MRNRFINWMLVAAGFLGPAASTALAQGSIVTTVLPNPMSIWSWYPTIEYPIDVNSDSVTDFTFAAEAGFVGLRTERANQLVYRIDPPPNIGGPVANLPEGFAVGSSLDPQLAWISSDPVGGYVSPGENAFATIAQHLSSGTLSEWPGIPGARGFIGVQFELDDDFITAIST
ncbi:MAG TPA: hypothetical protein PLY00_18030 [Verrucomicrobiota bacterium]|jgi:hypothetical protein|nr:MAG: hypothetical protein BWX48_00600 [Verrucomicrobia bacterium ADurb.Bin006]HOA63244.1 hypothetical protein [Verrucomicrobiota bacterium]HOR73158.1 hypothetical protein [Verrucomicrobiota bacterium]HPK99653.1 hypothetical protein [Verrucomicrobiota bacterium]HPW82635.1 hypothetical protein [Verrucomicrobiota bacterium]